MLAGPLPVPALRGDFEREALPARWCAATQKSLRLFQRLQIFQGACTLVCAA
jgi:hypothetical protein